MSRTTKHPSTPREHAFLLIAACEFDGAKAYEEHVIRIARKWMRMLDSPRTTQVSVDRMLEELAEPAPADYGMHWETLRREIFKWARAEGWVESGDVPAEV